MDRAIKMLYVAHLDGSRHKKCSMWRIQLARYRSKRGQPGAQHRVILPAVLLSIV